MKKMNEKTVKVISCAVAVGVMILLLSGDFIVSQFIRVYPNQNDTEEIEEQTNEDEQFPIISNDDEYDISFMKQVTLEEAIDAIESDELVFIFFGNSASSLCQNFVSILKDVAFENDITNILYIDQTTVELDTEAYNHFLNYSEMIQNEFGATPFFLIFYQHQHSDSVLGMDSNVKETLESKISVYLESSL